MSFNNEKQNKDTKDRAYALKRINVGRILSFQNV